VGSTGGIRRRIRRDRLKHKELKKTKKKKCERIEETNQPVPAQHSNHKGKNNLGRGENPQEGEKARIEGRLRGNNEQGADEVYGGRQKER